MDEIHDSLGWADEVLVWNNAERPENLRAYGRYEVMAEARNDLIAVQDDDLVVECWPLLLDAWQPGRVVVNLHRDVPWVGFGAVFERDMPKPRHEYYLSFWPKDELFLDYCDAIFTLQSPRIEVTGAYRDLPWATAPNRTYMQTGYFEQRRPMMIQRIEEL